MTGGFYVEVAKCQLNGMCTLLFRTARTSCRSAAAFKAFADVFEKGIEDRFIFLEKGTRGVVAAAALVLTLAHGMIFP